MSNRWAILALLFSARVVMAFQFQSVAALAPELRAAFLVGIDAIGLAIGLYMLPGIFVSLPGAVLATRIDAARITMLGLVLMTAGAVLMAVSDTWSLLLAGHAIAGVGGVVLNVLMTRMVADWFEGKELTTALAIFVNSYPAGIAIALLTLPVVGMTIGFWISVVAAAVALTAFATLYRAPDTGPNEALAPSRASPRDWRVGIFAGGVWGLFNGGVALVFGLGPVYLIERGLTAVEAGSLTSVLLITTAIGGPFGGMIVDRFGGRDLIVFGSLLWIGVITFSLTLLAPSILPLALIGLATGFVAGPIMSLPAAGLSSSARTVGMGVFFTVYYLAIVTGPVLGGWLSGMTGTAKAALYLGAAFQIAAIVSLGLYRKTVAITE